MNRDTMYLRCPYELPGFINKFPYYDNPTWKRLAMPNHYYKLPGTRTKRLEANLSENK